jgi:ubiquinone/menaquinone biosynthesis C-methylase UbiE
VSNQHRPFALLQRTSGAETPRCWCGTGFYIANAGLTRSQQVGLLDLNENCLRAAAARVKQAKVRTFRRDMMQPSSEPADTGYDSISLIHVLHCLPGTMDDKETAIANLKRYLSKNGVFLWRHHSGG